MGKHVAVLCLLVGCGRFGFDDMQPESPPPSNAFTHEIPAVCGMTSIAGITPVTDADLSVAVSPTTVALFSVPTTGGNLFGAALDRSHTVISQGTVRTGPFTQSGAAYVDGTLIAATVSGQRTLVNNVAMTMDGFTEIGNVDGEMVGKQSLLYATSDRITPTACSGGLIVNPFSQTWTQGAQYVVSSAQSTGIGVVADGNEVLAAWSTDAQCNVYRITDGANATGNSQPWACGSPRLSIASGVETMLFEASDGVRLASIDDTALSSGSMLLVDGGTSPRILYDGTRTWIAYRDASGQLQFGAYDETGRLQIVASGLYPAHDAFEFAIVDGELYLYAISGGAYDAIHACMVSV
ncbi:MAG: hypothetical protein QM831_03905 [Kofleriaceae bacterium]